MRTKPKFIETFTPMIIPCFLPFAIVGFATMAVKAQNIAAFPTYHNIGVEVRFDTAPPASTTINLAIKEDGESGDYRPIHPLSGVSPTRWLGSAFSLRSGTAYFLRLSSPAFAATQYVKAATREEKWPQATNNTYHVDVAGNDAHDGKSFGGAFLTLNKAVEVARAGDRILVHDGRYYQGDIELPHSGTFENPIVIEAAPGAHPVFDGTDTNFVAHWEVYDAAQGLYRTPATQQPVNAYLDGEHLFHFQTVEHLRTKHLGQATGYVADGAFLYARFPGDAAPGTHQLTIPRHTYGLHVSSQGNLQIRGLEFCYYGSGLYHNGIYLQFAHSNLIEHCEFHHNGIGIGMKAANGNTIQYCHFNESPINQFSWDTIKQGNGVFPPIDYEAGGVYVYSISETNSGNVIRYNRFENLFDGAHLFSILEDGPTENMDFHDNVILHCGDDGLETDGAGSNVRIYRNLFQDFLSGISVAPAALGPVYIYRNQILDWHSVSSVEGVFEGYPIKSNSSDPAVCGVHLYHNTCVTVVPGQQGFLFKSEPGLTNFVSRNNIYVGTRNSLESWHNDNVVDLDYDLLYAANGAAYIQWKGNQFANLKDFSDATGLEIHGLFGDPRFMGTGDYRLQPDSPSINQGVVIPGINDDYLGNGPDMGAFEYSVTTNEVVPKYTVLVGASVGDAWGLANYFQRADGTPYVSNENTPIYQFDKQDRIRELILRTGPTRPAAVIIKECAAYFNGSNDTQVGSLAAAENLVVGWINELRVAGIVPILATVVPINRRAGEGWQDRLQGITTFNDWVRQYARSNRLALLDLESAVRVSAVDRSLRLDLDDGDGLHLNTLAYTDCLNPELLT